MPAATETAAPPAPAPPRGKRPVLMKVLVALALVLVAFAILIATRPSEFRVARSATMSAPPAAVFVQVNDFQNWANWSPWEKLDPNMKRSFEGPSAGTGAVYRWAGDKNVGEGSMTITESRPSDLIRIRLEFLKPFAATNTTEFTFTPQGDQTAVT